MAAAQDVLRSAPVLYTFKSKLSAEQLLRVIGKQPSAMGIIAPASMPAAMGAIDAAIAQEEAQRRAREAKMLVMGRRPMPDEGVTLRQRSWPLMRMLALARAEGMEVLWTC